MVAAAGAALGGKGGIGLLAAAAGCLAAQQGRGRQESAGRSTSENGRKKYNSTETRDGTRSAVGGEAESGTAGRVKNLYVIS
jgi:hypothetical protein